MAKEMLSFRIVDMSHYMHRPVYGLDPCFSEFRAKEIKSVPVLRIFGSTSDGIKTCLHVHGVLPYFFIPYEIKTMESFNKFAYQLCENLDKALNVSLGQSSSQMHHIFKVQLVKAYPFYGYHRKEHLFLKIYMYNPRLLKRAANLLQNGALNGKTFQAFESHVPYRLQFLIDYNLFPMSFLHVPMHVIKVRKSDEIPLSFTIDQILGKNIERVSTSKLEIDINAAHILNRIQLQNEMLSGKKSINPGIESIWQDEEVRRKLLIEKNKNLEFPVLEVPAPDERFNIKPTDSEIFYKNALERKLIQCSSQTSDTTLDNTIILSTTPNKERTESPNQKKKKFNVTKLLKNSIYPEECTQEDDLLNATIVQNHVGVKEFSDKTKSCQRESIDDNIFDEDTLDEEEILSLSQHPYINLNLNDTSEQGILKFIEELNQEDDDKPGRIDMNSSLAPFSEENDDRNHQEILEFLRHLDKEESDIEIVGQNTSKVIDLVQSDSDDDCLNDFTMANQDIEEILRQLSQRSPKSPNHESIPQLDGLDDSQRTPKKSQTKSLMKNSCSPKKQSPRTPRTPRTPKRHRYAPLKGIKIFSPKTLEKINESSDSEAVSASSDERYNPYRSIKSRKLKRNILEKINNSKKLTNTSTTISQDFIIEDLNSVSSHDSIKPNNIKNNSNLDKTETKITCNLKLPKKVGMKNKLKIEKQSPSTTKKLKVVDIIEKNEIKKTRKGKTPSTEKNSNLDKRLLRHRMAKRFNSVDSISQTIQTIQSNKKHNTQHSEFNFEFSEKLETAINELKVKSSVQNHVVSNTSKDESASKTIQPAKKQKVNDKNKDPSSTDSHDKVNNNYIKPHVLQSLRELGLSFLNNTEKEKNLKKQVNIKIESACSEKVNSKNHESKIKNVNIKIKKEKTFKLKKCKVRINRLDKRRKTDIKEEESVPKNVKEHDDKLNYPPEPGTSKSKVIYSKRQLNRKIAKNDTTRKENKRLYIKLNKDNDEIAQANLEDKKEEIEIIDNKEYDDHISPEIDGNEEDLNIYSFYEKSFLINESPTMFSDLDSPHSKFEEFSNLKQDQSYITPKKQNQLNNSELQRVSGKSESMSPLQFSIGSDDCNSKSSQNNEIEINEQKSSKIENIQHDQQKTVNEKSSLDKLLNNFAYPYGKPEVINTMPFYSNPADVRKSKEVGHMTLHIPLLTNQNINLENDLLLINNQQNRRNSSIKEPTKSDLNNEENKDIVDLDLDDDSPIKIRRQKIAMILNESENESADDCDRTLRSLSCSPVTPKINLTQKKDVKIENKEKSNLIDDTTPKSSKNCKISLRKVSLKKLMSNSPKDEIRKSLQKKLFADRSFSIESSQKSDDSNQSNIKCVPIDILLSDDVNVEDALAYKNAASADSSKMHIVFSDMNKSVSNINASQNLDRSFGLSGASLDNTYGFKVKLENLQQAKADVDYNYLTTISLEVFVKTRGSLHPDPAFDEICGIFYAILNDVPQNHKTPSKVAGYILLAQPNDKNPKLTGVEGVVTIVNTEQQLFDELLKLVQYWDPDILAGYEIELSSWGYVLDRSKALKTDFIQLLSRVPSQKVYEHLDDDEPKESYTDLDHESKIYGRILLDVWRLLRSEIALTSYTFENVMYHISHKRIPKHAYQKLTEFYLATQTRWIVIEYYLERVNGVMELLDQLDLIGRTCEMAKLIGIQFYEILSRGSQYRVESMMLRIAKPKNLIPMSPSPQQRLHMRAPEYLPLILEPQSRFYADPLIVLDFQSLYPSVMIAYNYCFSTCLGRVEHLGSTSPFEFGVSMLRVSPTMLRKLIAYDMVTISPCGAVFVKQEIREGILPQMLREILDTRFMVKKSMKLHKTNQLLQRVLHSRQLALKLMANVTYGYTAANFSGRMPCVEVGDSIVAKGRETLERAIKLVEATPKWGVEVVYGDTDSLFVLCPGKTRETAFKIGEEIAEAVTKDNPFPIKLKLEKVYQPSILQTKKRYVGFMYETPDQTEPIYEAKGIETVRRDGCPAVVKMLEKSLKVLFQTKDVSKVKQYVCRQFTKILQGKANVQDLIFAKEFRGRFGYKPGACVPALELTRKWMLTDPRKEPRRGERVPYIVTNGPPGLPIIRLIRCPHEVLNDPGLKINAIYYITRAIIPALNRCFLLIGADIHDWFAELPRKNTQLLQFLNEPNNRTKFTTKKGNKEKKTTISQYFSTSSCALDCGNQTKCDICNDCKKNIQSCVIKLKTKIAKLERAYYLTQNVCQSCCGRTQNIDCTSLECPVLYVKEVKFREFKQVAYYNELINKLTISKHYY